MDLFDTVPRATATLVGLTLPCPGLICCGPLRGKDFVLPQDRRGTFRETAAQNGVVRLTRDAGGRRWRAVSGGPARAVRWIGAVPRLPNGSVGHRKWRWSALAHPTLKSHDPEPTDPPQLLPVRRRAGAGPGAGAAARPAGADRAVRRDQRGRQDDDCWMRCNWCCTAIEPAARSGATRATSSSCGSRSIMRPTKARGPVSSCRSATPARARTTCTP